MYNTFIKLDRDNRLRKGEIDNPFTRQKEKRGLVSIANCTVSSIEVASELD